MKEALYDLFLDPLLHHSYFARALLAGSLVAVVCGTVGCFIILRRMAFLGDAIAHAMLAGVTAGYLFMQVFFGRDAHAPAMIIGSILAGFVTVALIGFVSRVSRIKDDTAIGIMYTGIFALGGLMASMFSDRIHIDLLHFMMGQVLAVGDTDMWMMAIVSSLVLAVIIIFFRPLQLTSFDPILAASIGIPVVGINYLLTTCTSLVVVSAVQIVGVVLVVGLLVTPAACAYLVCDRLSRMLFASAVFGVTSVVGGMYLSEWMDVAAGSAIVVMSTLQFMAVLVFAPKYGILAGTLRRRAHVPQEIIEDVLGHLRRNPGEAALQIATKVGKRPHVIKRALRRLDRDEMVQWEGLGYHLTQAGENEATRLVRAHRLWETYLHHVGTPADQVHDRAHELEHTRDKATVDYLDDKLGHPLKDPHGSEIPEDSGELVAGAQVKASLLREGRSGTIVQLGNQTQNSDFVLGGHITAGPRQDEGRSWTFLLDGGREVTLDHISADELIVELDREPSP